MTGRTVCTEPRGPHPPAGGCQHQARLSFVTEVSVPLCTAGADLSVPGQRLACFKPAPSHLEGPKIPARSPLITRTRSPAEYVRGTDVCHSDLGPVTVTGRQAGSKACMPVAISLLG